MNRKRILVVDDEVAFTRLLKLNLEQTNRYEVRITNWPEDAVSAAREFQPDLVLLDIFMPRLLGGDVAARLRADPDLRTVPIVFVTAAVSKPRVKAHGGVINGFPVLAKPASVEEIVEHIELWLSERPGWERACCSVPPPGGFLENYDWGGQEQDRELSQAV